MAHTYPELTWRETTSGVWQRTADEVEQFYSALATLYEGSGLMFFAITGHVSLRFDTGNAGDTSETEELVDKALKAAWLALRYDHPTIASQVTQDLTTGKWTKTYRRVSDPTYQQNWLEETLVYVSSASSRQTGQVWANNQPPAPKLPTLFVLSPSSSKEGFIRRDLVFRSPHDVIDGVGTLILLNNLISHASKAFSKGDDFKPPDLDGSEAANLSPPYRVAANVPPTLTDEQEKRLADMAAQKSAAMGSPHVEILDMPYRRGANLPARHQRVAHTLTKEQTARLTVACKTAGTTVTHAFHAAIALVLRDIQEQGSEARPVRYVNYILRNERASCQAPYNSYQHPAALYHSLPGQSLVVDMDPLRSSDDQIRAEEFLRVVKLMRDFYHGVRNDKEHYALAPTIWAASVPDLPTSPRPLTVPPPKAHPSVSISSMGRVDSIIAPKTGAIEAYDPWVTGEELGNGLGLFLGTFRDELCLSAAYNDAWHTEANVLNFLKRCEDVVLHGFGLSCA
ncbi:hypothetical protein CH063_08472 [Colletotrichum higginsianum]|uniref:Cytochrome p450 n=2 Tax=Colletotrichum higginsianum TaxID=80884 RepID=H1V9Z5_COLHI|nr:Cytochrome p450 [Colletotrichum higginsianum IMI 349063]OBR10767.1 Cytochrome p450 [Colletotrichum higginsianum IMI 349063]TID07145.1 hypothetical protein CH35J_000699 [Colletotrichum higginsianum]CCF37048.1 hypothetical protein CH063_08472 [Colletotrichum higginsianum]